MSVKLLDPTLDVVFKLLLLRDQSLLRDMIESVVNLRVPIAELEVQNPEIPEDAPGDKSVVLDIRVRLSDGRLIDLEMQSTTPPGTAERFVYYWARNFVDSIARGDDYTAAVYLDSVVQGAVSEGVAISFDLRGGGLGIRGSPLACV